MNDTSDKLKKTSADDVPFASARKEPQVYRLDDPDLPERLGEAEQESNPQNGEGDHPKAKDRHNAENPKRAQRQNLRKNQNQNKGPNSNKGQNRNAGQNQNQNKVQNQNQTEPEFRVLPTAPPAQMRTRHWALFLSFLLLVILPFAAICYYLWGVSHDQYSSTSGFTVRQEEGAGAHELLGGIAQLTGGGGGGSDGNILYEFILSQELVQGVDSTLNIKDHYSARWEEDPVFAIWPDATIEELLWFWQRVVRISYDEGSGLIELRVLAYEPEMAQNIGQEIVRLSQAMINDLNEQARSDALRYASADLEASVARLKDAREALTGFRTRTQIVDPEADLQGRMGVMNNLQQQLAEALIEFDLLSGTTRSGDPRLSQAENRIGVIRERIVQERLSFATDGGEGGSGTSDYPNLIAEYEGLVVDREFAEESYRAALAAFDVARAKASRQSRYLATYVHPTLSESSLFPRRWVMASLGGLFLLLSWGVMALVYYSIRDRS
ncbi:MAG: sugar transporter [Paracoccaceae bacterium]